ncbi:MAG: hypothetical protein IT534_14280 [Bauldia sp.]|nr:hypothetical protein [Bauldia sp.]
MADQIDSLVIGHLRHIRKTVEATAPDLVDVKARMPAMAGTLGHVLTQLAVINGGVDRVEERLGRVERRLELADAWLLDG